MADSLVGLDSGGCVTPIANGTVGQVLTIGAGGTPVWVNAADDQIAAEVPYAGGAIGTPLEAIATVEDALDTIAPCMVCSISATNTCGDGGVGSTYMVRTATKNDDGTLLLNAAPEHYSQYIGNHLGTTVSDTVASADPGVWQDFGLRQTFNVPNSTCRPMNTMLLLGTSGCSLEVQTANTFAIMALFFSIDGVDQTFSIIGATHGEPVGRQLFFPSVSYAVPVPPIAAGTIPVYQARLRVLVQTGSVRTIAPGFAYTFGAIAFSVTSN